MLVNRAPAPLALALALCVLPGCIVIPIGDLLRPQPLEEQVLSEGPGFFSKEKIAIIEISGVISGGGRSSLLMSRADTVVEVRSRLKQVAADPDVKGILLKISSPGGEVTASDQVYEDLMRFKAERGIPIVASIVQTGASGAYYVAMAADRVIAHPTAIVGSIGVILQSYNLTGLMDIVGVQAQPVKSAPHKDLNSPLRDMDAEEREILQKLVDSMYERFVGVVDRGRPGLTTEQVRELADGRIVSGDEAAEIGLVDSTGYLRDAVEQVRELAGIGQPTVVIYARSGSGGLSLLASGGDTGPLTGRDDAVELRLRADSLAGSGPGLYYLWQPGL